MTADLPAAAAPMERVLCEPAERLEELITCPICFEPMDTAMTLTCSHNFCSLCIRRSLQQYKGECPMCRKPAHQSDLRANRALDDLVGIFGALRNRLMDEVPAGQTADKIAASFKVAESKLAQQAAQPTAVAVKPAPASPPAAPAAAPTPAFEAKPVVASPPPPPAAPQAVPPDTDQRPGRVTCPICARSVPQSMVNSHLDQCLFATQTAPAAPTDVPRRRPKTYVYHLMKDKDIRAMLSKSGLPTNGNRGALLWRLKEFHLLQGAQMDKVDPASDSELAQRIIDQERARASGRSVMVAARTVGIETPMPPPETPAVAPAVAPPVAPAPRPAARRSLSRTTRASARAAQHTDATEQSEEVVVVSHSKRKANSDNLVTLTETGAQTEGKVMPYSEVATAPNWRQLQSPILRRDFFLNMATLHVQVEPPVATAIAATGAGAGSGAADAVDDDAAKMDPMLQPRGAVLMGTPEPVTQMCEMVEDAAAAKQESAASKTKKLRRSPRRISDATLPEASVIPCSVMEDEDVACSSSMMVMVETQAPPADLPQSERKRQRSD